jgi:hypothetical protein
MRKFIVAATLTALGAVLLVSPASASFDPHFTVLAKLVSFHEEGNGFRFRQNLLDPHNHHDRVGGYRARCKSKAHETLKCRTRTHLNGEIGGFGEIGASGNIRRHDHRLNVTGGTHDFNGVAGKLLLSNLNKRLLRLHFDLVR